MQTDSHEWARALLQSTSSLEEISADERRWLACHTAECAECGLYAELSQRAIQASMGLPSTWIRPRRLACKRRFSGDTAALRLRRINRPGGLLHLGRLAILLHFSVGSIPMPR